MIGSGVIYLSPEIRTRYVMIEEKIRQIQLGFFPPDDEDEARQRKIPTYEEVDSPELLANREHVIQKLESIDWAFTEDETGFLNHDLHPYTSKFIPQIPGNLIANLSLRGELVLDPFGGSGTTALEAVRIGRRAVSIDANPIGTLIGKVKTSSINQSVATDLHAIRSSLKSQLGINESPESVCKSFANFIPEIPNIGKWFPETSRGELALIKSKISSLENETAKEIAMLAFSKIVLAVSFQDSETRYSSKAREIQPGETIRRYLIALDKVVESVEKTQSTIRYGVSQFLTADSRDINSSLASDNSVDLIVTSPPYGNANDYHLYHRFRLLWLGSDPRALAKIEIGSHLRHQKESSGFDSYLEEIKQSLTGMYRVLKPGRYIALVVGDAIYEKVLYSAAESICEVGESLGFERVCLINRTIHKTKRSFANAARRAVSEKILIMQKPPCRVDLVLAPPPYKLWEYEKILRNREIESISDSAIKSASGETRLEQVDSTLIPHFRKLVFTHKFGISNIHSESTWQSIIENGLVTQVGFRKDPKYVTHGLHDYKGKFYPQLGKALLNLSGIKAASNVLDPFCGSGTTLLEGYLNGFRTYGCDLHPLAAKIAKAKTGILDVDPDVVREASGTLVTRIEKVQAVDKDTEQIPKNCIEEVLNWFPEPVVYKINWLLRSIRSVSSGIVNDYLEVILSSILRDVSQQDPFDLRIRKRKELLEDADVLTMYVQALEQQYKNLEKFWKIRGYSPEKFWPCKVIAGDSRDKGTFDSLGIEKESVNLILTSPPYATALPYIDTDRLSLLVLFGIDASSRRPLEQNLVGSREIMVKERKRYESKIAHGHRQFPSALDEYLTGLFDRVSKADVGFRRKNMPALLTRFFEDMDSILTNCARVLAPGSEMMIVIGDNRMKVDGDYERIPTTDFVNAIAVSKGMVSLERINIDVTTENLVHVKNAITENVVLRLKKPKRET